MSDARQDRPALLRPAEPADADEIAEVHLAARADAVTRGLMPPAVRGDAQIRSWLADRMSADEVWVAEAAGAGAAGAAGEPGEPGDDAGVTAYLRMTPTWIDDLYVHPAHQRLGLGSALLSLAQSLRPGGLGLYVFETNAPARALYDAHGFAPTGRGRDNEEGAPDLRMEWRP